jgi:predicted secreted protein
MAANATTYTGENGALKYDVAGTPTAVAAVRSFTIDVETSTVETTVMGASGGARTFLPTQNSFSGSADVYLRDEDAAQDQFYTAVSTVTEPVTLEVYPSGATLGTKLSGEVIVTGYSITSNFDGLVEASITFQGTGILTKTDIA